MTGTHDDYVIIASFITHFLSFMNSIPNNFTQLFPAAC
ncbi:hypothetical protein CGLO_14046 [Colletotrichum gloeosporioides Cg-14]|uniref:Uncharacterized protein n=1 Tax=Colletotrichum gloeosporioides (strain Cg-14) TaxID=1237896 RepID=T0K2B2_COLGC|nr:hypothetical protein CGLO_14046 [Colletotrichum gloeosporioides Cg-14]